MDSNARAPQYLQNLERIGTVAIIGVGLIGGSIGLALRARASAHVDKVIGIGRDLSRLAQALALRAVDEITTDWSEGLKNADVVVICTPVDQIIDNAVQAAKLGPPHLLITDAGSAKKRIVAGIEASPAGSAFVGAHPLAGSERQGVEHANADLFDGRRCVLTRTLKTPPDRFERAQRFWLELGCRLVEMSPEEHDRGLALTSHLPHAVAAALASAVPETFLELGAGAFRDGTRVAESSADLWTAIFLENRLPLLQALNEFDACFSMFREALHAGDREAILAWWRIAVERRRRFSEQVLTSAPSSESHAP